jgi:ribosomal protein S14
MIMTTSKREVCHCEKCGNEAEMTITCELVDVAVAPKVIEKKTKEHRVCSVCGNEADLIIAFDE